MGNVRRNATAKVVLTHKLETSLASVQSVYGSTYKKKIRRSAASKLLSIVVHFLLSLSPRAQQHTAYVRVQTATVVRKKSLPTLTVRAHTPDKPISFTRPNGRPRA